ncbi:hypothetical protein KY289_000556 [Solanum tuberosum]|nr:hypothetical protein KY289_000556 [Solanum tuberosum]
MNFPNEESDNSTISVEDEQIKRVQLKMQFQSTRKEDLKTIESYVNKLKSIANSVAEIDSPISDTDMVLQLLAGLPNQYLPLKNTISSMRPLPNFEEASSMLYKHEGMSFRKDESNNSSTNSAEDDQIRRAQLQIQFHGTRREDFQPIESYVKKLKYIANSLAEIDSPISDSVMVLQLLAGLPIEYLPLKNTILSKCPLPTFEDACSMVYMQEDILLQDREEKFKADAGGAGFCSADTFYTVVDTVGVVVGAVGAVGTICAGVGALGTAAGAVITVNASRIIVGSAITAVAGWKIWQRK